MECYGRRMPDLQAPGAPSVDGMYAAPAPPANAPSQDMVYQWVDLPHPPRLPPQAPPYMQAPPTAANYGYYPGYGTADPYSMPAPPYEAASQPYSRQPYADHGGSHQGFGQQRWPTGGGGKASGGRGAGRKGKGADDPGSRTRTRPQHASGGGRQAAQHSSNDHPNGRELSPEALKEALVDALESLYQDRIKPLSNYIKGRLKERSCPENVTKNFVELYANHGDLFDVQRPTSDAEEAAVYLKTNPSWFKGWVDIDAPDDPYDEKMWAALAKFLDGEHAFAGGRYGMARELAQKQLDFLKDCSLGEICHIVQLAIQTRKLIVYHRKMLKPIQTVLCQMQPGEASAGGAKSNGVAAIGGNEEGDEITSMDDLCAILFRMLTIHKGLRLCRLKQMIKHECSRKLSEMSFRCTKLIELFNTEPLAGTFVLDTDNDGKSIYVRLGDPASFSEHMKLLYAAATSQTSK